MDQLALRFSITSEEDLQELAKLMIGTKDRDWFSAPEAHIKPPGHGRLVHYQGKDIIFVCVERVDGPLATTAIPNYYAGESSYGGADCVQGPSYEELLAELDEAKNDTLVITNRLTAALTRASALEATIEELQVELADMAAANRRLEIQVEELQESHAPAEAVKALMVLRSFFTGSVK
jgi:hypothetical protein